MEHTLTFQDRAGHRVAAVLATPDRPTDLAVVLLHGFLSNKNSTTNKTLTRAFLEQGFATFRFDFFGQGESEGPFERITVTTALDQAQAAIALVASRGYRRIGLIGSSFGGLIALLAAAEPANRTPLASLALKCPVPDFEEMLRLEFGPEGIVEWKRTGTIPNVTGGGERVPLHYAFYEDCGRYRGYDAAKTIAVPTLIVQGDQDEFVPLHQSRRLLDALPEPKRLDILPGADHGFSKAEDFRAMAGKLVEWTVTHVRASAS
ncbi:MAG: alpha/beta hydrolase [Nitrospirota bacterium]|nr:alpha/beta hydrolase [Nitrospirota bacterium]MDE3036109.1 alpha/beta hydrolase [Nitrospirota bacterium]MDE3119972.1 alpha/beta hydrolase [Nitrospirota bacterium]MDE3225630.1 alpha/beta hydrolase [Nitrospirota bacterium]MDE3241662.1 alpha/beta hydrolase [Nitrospirota bacterium]